MEGFIALESIGLTAIAVFVFAVVLLWMMVKSIPQGEEWTVERFGRYTRTLKPGLRFLIPIMDKVGAKINMMETVLDIDSQEVITRDNAVILANAVAYINIISPEKKGKGFSRCRVLVSYLVKKAP